MLDFGAGSGLLSIAAGKAGARTVVAADIDAFARAAIALNCAGIANAAPAEAERLRGAWPGIVAAKTRIAAGTIKVPFKTLLG